MTVEGELVVRLERSDRRVRGVTIRSTRPHGASRVALGRAPADAATTIASLFGICAHGQGAAAALALEAATGATPRPPRMAARETSVLLETTQEYLWRMLIDWPQAQGCPPAVEPVAELRRRVAPALAHLAPIARAIDGRGSEVVTVGVDVAAIASDAAECLMALATRHVFAMASARWLELGDRRGVAAWAATGATLPARLLHELLATSPELGRSDVPLMPPFDRDALLAAVVPAMRTRPAFERVPTWDGVPVETGALSRLQAHPIVASFAAEHGNAVTTRMVARMAEFAELVGLTAMRGVDGCALGDDEGLASVQTARGLLLHRARVANGCVTDYQIVAPTEWNFHPDGALVRGLTGVAADDEAALARDARLVVQALDPCVGCRIEIADA